MCHDETFDAHFDQFFVQIAPATDANTNQFSFQQTGAEQEQQGFNF